MATGNIDQAQGVLKIVTGRYTKNYELAALAYNRANKGAGQPLSDRGFEIPTEIEGNFAHGWMTDGGDYPAGGSVKTIREDKKIQTNISSLFWGLFLMLHYLIAFQRKNQTRHIS